MTSPGSQSAAPAPAARRVGLALLTAALLLALAAYAATRSHAANATPGAVAGIVDINTNLKYQGAAAAGTGMVLTSSGEVLTNNHVIRGATSIHVTDLDNGRTYAATVVGYDLAADVSVLQLTNASGLRTVPLGNSATLKVGEAIKALGNAGGVGGTPSEVSGTVTALDRSITAEDDSAVSSERLTGLVETNAAIQPGDSGGPIVNAAGMVVGMDTAASQGFSFEGVPATQGFAIPINRATSVAALIEAGRGSATIHIGATPFLGVGVEPANSFNNGFGFVGTPNVNGVVVSNVITSSPAAKAGLGQNDVITAIDGRTIASPAALTDFLITKAPGTVVQVGWTDQNGTKHTSSLTLASGPPQ